MTEMPSGSRYAMTGGTGRRCGRGSSAALGPTTLLFAAGRVPRRLLDYGFAVAASRLTNG